MTERLSDKERFMVVKNATGRWSCWPTDRPVPDGWTATSFSGSKEECLQSIRNASQSRTKASRGLRMSMMFFGDSELDAKGDKYRLPIEASKFADRRGFEGIWIPERHFTKFGCLYPSPSVLHAAISQQTRSIRLRAGSVVMPLNDPVRVAEEWSVVDNLSQGRVEIAFASGWHPDDFALHPESYPDRSELMYQGIRQVESLWRGMSIERTNGAGRMIDVKTFPTPVQSQLPVWLTAAGNPETFRQAGTLGYGVLTHLFHQDIGQLAEKIEVYKNARRAAGHAESGDKIAVTLHTFVGETIQQVREQAGAAYCRYLKSNLGLLNQLAFSQGQTAEIESLPKAEFDQMLQYLLEKFIGGRSLMGTPETCEATCRDLVSIGVTEVACLLDFGPDTDDVLQNLPRLGELCDLASRLELAY